MRRLIRRDRRERGAVAVVVAICMVVLMGFTALAVDVGSIYSDRQQLQNGADAAALAIAESCQRGLCIDSADKYVKANKLDGQATGTAVINKTAGLVTVEAKSTHQNWFARVLGIPTTAIGAPAEATYGYPSGGATLPLAFSWCAFNLATGGWDDQGKPLSHTPVVVNFKDKTMCSPPAHNEVPGGFGWLINVNCIATFLAGNWVTSDPGNSEPASCKNFDWTTIQNKTVLVPIFEDYQGNGSNAQYKIKGLAAFTITGYCFSNAADWNLDKCPSNKRIQGNFTNYTDLSGNYTIDPNAPHFGVGEVKLYA